MEYSESKFIQWPSQSENVIRRCERDRRVHADDIIMSGRRVDIEATKGIVRKLRRELCDSEEYRRQFSAEVDFLFGKLVEIGACEYVLNNKTGNIEIKWNEEVDKEPDS